MNKDKNIQIVGIISSSNRHGNTATLTREALKVAQESGADVTEIFLPEKNIEFCTGCMRCMAEGKCYIQDDFEGIKSQIVEADGIIWGSPTFAGTMNAIMKNLLERLGLFERMTSSVFGGKYTIGISTAGSMGADKTAHDLVGFVKGSIFQRGYVSGTFGFGLKGAQVKENPAALKKIHDLGRKIVQDIQQERTYPFQNIFGRLLTQFVVKPQFSRVIRLRKDENLKAIYQNLHQRGLLT